MKKIIRLLILVLSCESFVYSQAADSTFYQIVLLDGCTGKKLPNYGYIEILKRDEKGSVNCFFLNDSKYRIPLNEPLELIRYEDFDGSIPIIHTTEVSDTITTSCFMENNNQFQKAGLISPVQIDFIDTIFHLNHKPLEGLYTEYFHSGQLRIKGTFEKGKLQDTLFLYFRSGQVKSTFIIKNKRNSELNVYRPSGNLIKKVVRIKHTFYTFLEEEDKPLKKRITKNRIKYWDENGHLISWSKPKQEGEYAWSDHNLRTMDYKKVKISGIKTTKHVLKKYDENGILVKTIVFYHVNREHVRYYPTIRQLADEKCRVTLYQNGKKYIEIMREVNSPISVFNVLQYKNNKTISKYEMTKNELQSQFEELHNF